MFVNSPTSKPINPEQTYLNVGSKTIWYAVACVKNSGQEDEIRNRLINRLLLSHI